MTTLGFEGIGDADSDGAAIPDGYGHLDWSSIAVAGVNVVDDDPSSGYAHVLHGNSLAFLFDAGGHVESSFTAHNRSFTLKSGIFAAAWNADVHVKFTAIRGGEVVGHQNVTLDQDAVLVHFKHIFRHIDSVLITSKGGHDANPEDPSGSHLALDELVVKVDRASADVAAADRGLDMTAMPLHSDWPLA